MEQGQPQDPQAMMQEAMQGIQTQISAINEFSQVLAQTGKQDVAAKFAQGAKLLEEGLASLGAGAQKGPVPVGSVDEMGGTGGQPVA